MREPVFPARELSSLIWTWAPLGAVRLDRTGRILDVNPAFERMTGFMLSGNSPSRLVDWLENAERLAFEQRFAALEVGESFAGRYAVRLGDNLPENWQLQVTRTGPLEWAAFANPESDPVSAPSDCLNERSRLALLGMASGMAFRCRLDPDRNALMVSEGCFELTGYSVAELESGTPRYVELVHPEDRERIGQSWQPDAGTELPAETEYRIRHRSGEWRWVCERATAHPVGPDGPCVVEGLVQDITDRKRAENRELFSERRFRSIFESAPLCVKLFDTDGRFLEMNPAGLAMIGAQSEDQIRGRHILEPIVPRDRPAVEEAFARACAGETAKVQHEVNALNGDMIWIEQVFTRISANGSGEGIQILGISQDITDRKRAEAGLYESRERLRKFIESVPLGVVMLDRELRILACSERWLSENALSRDQVIGLRYFDAVPQTVERWQADMARCLAGETVRKDEDPVHRPDGTFDYRRWEMRPWYDAAGSVGGLVFFVENITDRVLARQALQTSEERLAESQRRAHLGSWTWEFDSDVIHWSDEVYRIFGHPPQSFLPSYRDDFLSAVHPDDRATVREAVEHSLATGMDYSIEHRILRVDGSVAIVWEQGEIQRDENGRPIRMHGTVQDVTELRRAEQQTEQLRDELSHLARVATIGELAAGIAHELNQPLSVISMDAFALRSWLEKVTSATPPRVPQECMTIAERMQKQAIRAGEIIRRMQHFSRKRSTTTEPEDIRLLINEVLALLKGEISRDQVELILDVPPTLPLVHVDAVQIQQVLFNLCRNAIDAMRQQPTNRKLLLCVRVLESNRLELCVRDSGPGILPEMRRQLFTPFVTSKPEGLGLGLAICRRIVEAHGGELELSDPGPPGAEFRCTLPLEAPE